MFNFFKKKDPIAILEKEYQKLMVEAHRLSNINRRESDQKIAETDIIPRKIENLQKQ